MTDNTQVNYWRKKAEQNGRIALFGSVMTALLGCVVADFISNERHLETINHIRSSSQPIEKVSSQQLPHMGNDLRNKDTVAWNVPAILLKIAPNP